MGNFLVNKRSVIKVICPNCGENNDSKFTFCVKCGTTLKGGAKTQQKGFFAKGSSGVSRADEYAATQRQQAAPQRKPAPAAPQQPKAPSSQVRMKPQTAQTSAPQRPAQQMQNPQAAQNRAQNMNPNMQQMPNMAQPQMVQPNMPQMQGMAQPQMAQPNMTMQNPAMPPNMQQMQNPAMQQMPNMNMPNPAMQQMPNMAQPQMAQPNMTMQNPAMQPNMPQGMNPNMAQNPQDPAMQQMGMQNPQMGMMNPQMQGMNMMGMMNPQMGMMPPQFMGYDQNGTPIYMQMVPQMMGYDAYGNPMYTMVPMQTYGMPQMMQGMQPMQGMMNPQMGMMQPNMPQGMNPAMNPGMQPNMPQAVNPNMPAMPQQPAVQQPSMPQPPQPPVQGTMQVSSFEDMPVSAEALMNEDENAEQAEAAPMPNEAELLDQIFSNAPKQYTMAGSAKPSGQVFSISLSASEVTSVADEEAKPAPKPQSAKPVKGKTAPEQPVKKPQRIVSPDDFFGDSSTPAGKKLQQMKVNTTVLEDEDALEEQIAALEAEGRKKSKRSMQAADHNLDVSAENGVENPAVAAAAQAILMDAEAAVAALEKKNG